MSVLNLPNSLRDQFPALAGSTVYLDNAGGSQLPRCVIEAVREYMTHSYAQLGGDYEPSKRAAATVKGAHDTVKTYLNADGAGEVVLGSSTTALCHVLANAYADANPARREIIVAAAGHEANIGPWMRLANRGFTIRLWPTEKDADGNFRPLLSTLAKLLSPRTLLVAFPQVSNILGEIWDARAVADLAHAAGARVVLDGVAFAPHRAPDMRALDCDWYLYSTYKVFGPHMAAMYGSHRALAEVEGPNHYFIPRGQLPYKFELGGVSHEGAAAIVALNEYVRFLAPAGDGSSAARGSVADRSTFEKAFAGITELETSLQGPLLAALKSNPRIHIVGPAASNPSRVCTISFVHATRRSEDIARAANAEGLGIRFGHFYSLRLTEELSPHFPNLNPRSGVVRVSLLHYNTETEVSRLIRFLDELK
jgi:cysteine desulfurase family protein (TIGR01976 family)